MHQVLGDPLGRFAVLGEHARDTQVRRGPLTRGLRSLDGGRDGGLREGQALAGHEYPNIDQSVDGLGRGLDVKLRHGARVTQLAVRPQDREGAQ